MSYIHTNPSVLAHRYKHLTVKSETEEKNGVPLVVLRPAVALAIVKILMRLPVWMLESKLPQLLTRVAAVMRDRCVLRTPVTCQNFQIFKFSIFFACAQ
jgi:hypothetical protein